MGQDHPECHQARVIKHAEKRLEDMRTARAQERIRGRASEHTPGQAAAAAARVQSSIVSFTSNNSSSSSSSWYPFIHSSDI